MTSSGMGRRDFFAGLLGRMGRELRATGAGLAAGLAGRPDGARSPKETPPAGPGAAPRLPPIPLRPPGALPEPEFLTRCQRCGACREACKPGVLLRLGDAYGKSEGTPGLFPETGACELCPGIDCARACPSGALAPPDHWTRIRLGELRIDPGKCLDVAGTPCDLCALACPSEVRAIRLTSAGPLVDFDRCTGCGQCVAVCPAEPRALRVQTWPVSPVPSPGEEAGS